MLDCHYSIIPRLGKDCRCAVCNKKIDDIPEYHQIEQLYICIDSEYQANYYVGLGVALPLCGSCDETISKKTKRQNRFMGCLSSFFLLIVMIVMLVMGFTIYKDSIATFICVISAVAIWIIMSLINKAMDKKSLSRIRGCGLNTIKPAIDYLSAKNWNNYISPHDEKHSYTHEDLKTDLTEICRDGKLCILNNATGHIENIEDAYVINKIFTESYEVYTYDNSA